MTAAVTSLGLVQGGIESLLGTVGETASAVVDGEPLSSTYSTELGNDLTITKALARHEMVMDVLQSSYETPRAKTNTLPLGVTVTQGNQVLLVPSRATYFVVPNTALNNTVVMLPLLDTTLVGYSFTIVNLSANPVKVKSQKNNFINKGTDNVFTLPALQTG